MKIKQLDDILANKIEELSQTVSMMVGVAS